MLKLGFVASWFAASIIALNPGVVWAQDYPSKPLRIVTGGVGSSSDFSARLVAYGLSTALGQQVVVENRGGGVFFGEVLSKSPADGYTLLVHGSSIWLSPFLVANVPYDPITDLLPISLTNMSPAIFVAHPSLPATVKEFIALAKARPGEINYTTGTTGSSGHLTAELFASMANVKIVRIRYKSGAQEIADLISGQVQMSFMSAGEVMPHVKSGKLRGLAVTSAQPFPLLPQMPTLAAAGVPGFESIAIMGMFAPAKTPTAIASRLNQEVVRVVNMAEVKEKFINTGVEPVGSSAEQFSAKIKSEMAKWGKLIKDAGIKDN